MSRRGKWFIAEKCGRSEPTPCQSCRTSARPTPATARTPRPARTGRSRPAEPAWDPSRACPWRGLGTRSTRSAGRRSWFGMPEDPIGTQPRRMYANQHEVSSSAQTQHTVTAHSTAHSHSTQHTAHSTQHSYSTQSQRSHSTKYRAACDGDRATRHCGDGAGGSERIKKGQIAVKSYCTNSAGSDRITHVFAQPNISDAPPYLLCQSRDPESGGKWICLLSKLRSYVAALWSPQNLVCRRSGARVSSSEGRRRSTSCRV